MPTLKGRPQASVSRCLVAKLLPVPPSLATYRGAPWAAAMASAPRHCGVRPHRRTVSQRLRLVATARCHRRWICGSRRMARDVDAEPDAGASTAAAARRRARRQVALGLHTCGKLTLDQNENPRVTSGATLSQSTSQVDSTCSSATPRPAMIRPLRYNTPARPPMVSMSSKGEPTNQ